MSEIAKRLEALIEDANENSPATLADLIDLADIIDEEIEREKMAVDGRCRCCGVERVSPDSQKQSGWMGM